MLIPLYYSISNYHLHYHSFVLLVGFINLFLIELLLAYVELVIYLFIGDNFLPNIYGLIYIYSYFIYPFIYLSFYKLNYSFIYFFYYSFYYLNLISFFKAYLFIIFLNSINLAIASLF